MALKKSTGDMYTFITHTWNPVKGCCPYDCSYCYVKRAFNRYGNEQKPLHLDEKELKTGLGAGNFIFVCSGCDLFHPDVPDVWIIEAIKRAESAIDNKYLWHTKNPERAVEFYFPPQSTLCVTIESDMFHPGISKAPRPFDRVSVLKKWEGNRMITIEPIMDFNVIKFADMIFSCGPAQVNIGADSGNNHLPEPPKEKIIRLIAELGKFTKVVEKKNLRRLMV
jgi:protein gp37